MARHYPFVNCPVMVPMTRSAGDTRKYDGVCCARLWNALPSSTLAIKSRATKVSDRQSDFC